MICPRCNNENDDRDRFCTNCGQPLVNAGNDDPSTEIIGDDDDPSTEVIGDDGPATDVFTDDSPDSGSASTAEEIEERGDESSKPKRKGSVTVVIAVVAVVIAAVAAFFIAGGPERFFGRNDADQSSGGAEQSGQTMVDLQPETRDYVGDESDWACHVMLTDSDIAGKSQAELLTLKNLIYARHGYDFPDAKTRRQFEAYKWYSPTTAERPDSKLNSIEKANIKLIDKYLK